MATRGAKSTRSRSGGGSKSKRTSSSNGSRGKSNGSRAKREFDDYSIVDPKEIPEGPDVLIDVPVVKVDEIDLEVDDLHAQVAVMAEVRDMVQLSVGADVRLGKVELKIEGVEAQALLKARLDNVTAILQRVLTTLDRNPEVLQSVGRTVEQVGGGARETLEGTGQAVGEVGKGAKGAVQDVGQGAGQAVGQIGQGAQQGVGQIGQGAGQAVGQVGQGANQALGEVGQGAGQGVAGVGQGAKQATGQLAGQGQ
jgi:hypothetical protein